ncbi:MAG: hypothetical protein JW795_14475, partial [Chitinivibrionales bacterium]|nr:hypothetical protein [Chitinivibrionales bacterium]
LIKNENNVIDTTEDKPIGFGYKSKWIAVRTNDKNKTAELLNLKNIQKANWNSGLENAYNNSVFITPQIGDWILAVGEGLPAGDSEESVKEIKSILEKISKEFGEAQFFCTHRIVEFHSWMKAENGIVKRVYSYLGESGINVSIEGEPTEAEKGYNLINTFSEEAKQDTYYDREDLKYPDEEFVMEIAEKWSINPTKIEERNDIKGLGLLGK